jgi:hypothetical protein
MYNLDEATDPTNNKNKAINGRIATFKYTYKLTVKANKEQTPIICKLTLKFIKVSIKAIVEDINPPIMK